MHAATTSAQAKKAPPQYTQVFGDALVRECRRDERIVGITAAMNSGTGLNILQEALPERYFDVGIAEQQAILFAAGLALQGVKPVAAIYSTFLQRAYDQIVHDVCLQRLNVVFALDRAGLVGDDGPTHHGAFDIAYLRCLPNIVLMAPRDEAMLVHMLHTALLYDDGPIALRYPRGEGTGVALPEQPRAIKIGTGEILREGGASAPAGQRVALIGYGSGVGKALEAAEELSSEEIDVTVADARFAKPIDAGLMAQLAAEHDLLVTVEEGVLAGGFGSAVWETLNETGARIPRILRVGLPDRYVTHGKPALLHEEVGFTGRQIAERVSAAITARSPLDRERCSGEVRRACGARGFAVRIEKFRTRADASAHARRRAVCGRQRAGCCCASGRVRRADRVRSSAWQARWRPARDACLGSYYVDRILMCDLDHRDPPAFVSRGGIKLHNALERLRSAT